MNLKETLGKLENWAKTFPESRTDEMVQLVLLGIDKGWYLNEVFLFAIYRDLQEGEDLNFFYKSRF